MSTIAELMVMVGADLTGLTSGLNSARNQVTGFGGSLRNVGQAAQRFGTGLTVAMAPVGFAFASGISAASDFESVMVQLQTFGGLTADELTRVSDLALQLGADTMFSASDAATAMLELTKSGMSVETAMQAAGEALQLAAVGGMDMATASTILSSSIAMFNLDPIDEAALVTQALASAASASAADVSDLAQGLTNVGPVAAQFGMSIGETAAALGVFANNGISGAEAGTQLRSMLLNMNRDTADVQGAWNALGVSLYDAEGNARSLDAVIDDLGAALEGMPTEEQNSYLQTLGGSYGIVGLSALIAAGGIDEMQTAMEGAPAAADIAAAQMETFAGKMDSLKGSIETFMITAGTPLIENVLKPLVTEATNVVNRITEWAEANPELAQTVGMVVGGLILAGPVIVAAGTVLSGLGTIAGVVGPLLGALVSPIGLMALAMGGVLIAGGRLDEFLTDIQTRAGEVTESWSTLREGFTAFQAGDTATGLEQIGSGLSGIATGILSIPVDLVENLAIAVGNILGIDVEGGIAAWSGVRDNLLTIFNQIKTNIETGIGAAIQGIVGTLSGLWESVSDGINTFKESMNAAFIWISENVIAPVIAKIAELVGAINGLAGTSIPVPTWTPVDMGVSMPRNPNVSTGGGFGGGFASGGQVRGGGPILVGERGPELFMPGAGGYVVNNRRLMGGGNTYVINGYGRSPYELLDELERAARNRG